MPGPPAVRARSQPQETPAPCAPRLGLLRGERSAFALSLRSAGDTERGEFVIPESASRLSGTHIFASAISGITGRGGRLYRPCIIGDGVVRPVAFFADAGEAEVGMEFVRARIVRVCVHFCAEPLAALGDLEGGFIQPLAEALSARGLRYRDPVDIEQVAALFRLPRFEPAQIGAVIGQRAGLDQRNETERRAARICCDKTGGQINPALQALSRVFMPHSGRRGLVDGIEGREV